MNSEIQKKINDKMLLMEEKEKTRKINLEIKREKELENKNEKVEKKSRNYSKK